MFPNKRIFSLVCAVYAAAALGGAANAQTGDDEYRDYGEAGDELVITAGRVAEEAAGVPGQVTVITAEDIAASGAASVVDALETVAGVRFSGAMAGPGSEAISMRGFGENSHGRVLVLVDGARLNNPDMQGINWNAIPLADIERIEVLDGSASVQYGNNAVGGVINIITKKDGRKRTAITLSGGSFWRNRESISHFEPLSWGNFSLSAEHGGAEGYRERQAAQTTGISGGANINLGEKAALSVNGFFSDLYYQLPGGLTKAEFEDDPARALHNSAYNGDDENTERHFGGGLGLQWFPLENLEINLPLSYRGKFIKSDMASASSSSTYTGKTVHSLEARPQAAYTFTWSGMSLRLLGGFDAAFAGLYADIYSNPAYTAKTHSFDITQWSLGPYLTARFSPLPGLAVEAGARFDTAILHAETRNGVADGDKTYSAFVYDAGVVWNPLESLKVYAKYAALFRYPFADEVASSYGTAYDEFYKDLEPEKGFNAEAGASYRFGNILDISANFFFMRLEDEIAFSGVTYKNENLDKTQRLGTNIGLSLSPFDWVSLDAAYSFVCATFINGVNEDKKIPLVPDHALRTSLLFKVQAGPGALSFGPDITFESERYAGGDTANIYDYDKIGNIFLFGAKIRYVLERKNGKFALQITGENLANLSYTKSVYNNGYGTSAYYPADGRSITVSALYQF